VNDVHNGIGGGHIGSHWWME